MSARGIEHLEQALLAAHTDGDTATLVALYARAAEGANSQEARAFFLTHAMVFAMEIGAPVATQLRAQLVSMGREAPAVL